MLINKNYIHSIYFSENEEGYVATFWFKDSNDQETRVQYKKDKIDINKLSTFGGLSAFIDFIWHSINDNVSLPCQKENNE
jgi:pimeloyl-CoA synthetase